MEKKLLKKYRNKETCHCMLKQKQQKCLGVGGSKLCLNNFQLYKQGGISQKTVIFFTHFSAVSIFSTIRFRITVRRQPFNTLQVVKLNSQTTHLGWVLLFYEITNRRSYMPSILFHCQVLGQRGLVPGHAGSKQLRRYYGLYQWLQIQLKIVLLIMGV